MSKFLISTLARAILGVAVRDISERLSKVEISDFSGEEKEHGDIAVLASAWGGCGNVITRDFGGTVNGVI
ncbi:hypothetical protein ERJ75_000338100 [Trypanosoma vivax]|nr:hypothetical protein ERJ75_000338100 [Trypanosoma vivax]